METLMKTLSWTRDVPATPAGSLLRHAAAGGLRTASAVLARLAEKDRAEQVIRSETDLRSVVERQRERVGG